MKSKGYLYTSILVVTLILSSCGTEVKTKVEDSKNGDISTVKNEDKKRPTLFVARDRNIIFELKQTTDESTIRDAAFEKVKQNENLNQGLLGKNTPELVEALSVQSIEAPVVMEALNEVYGGQSGFSSEGILFFENQRSGEENLGFWIGIKDPDERLTKFTSILQEKVDDGEILAKYIFIFKSLHTEKENFALTDKVAATVKAIAKNHHTPDRLSYGVSVDTKTGIVEINHDFLSNDQIENLQKQFADQDFIFTQDGRMVSAPGELDITYPPDPTVSEPSKDGAYVLSVTEKGFLIVDAMSKDANLDGVNDYYSAINYTYPNADVKLAVGQRVIVESIGGIMESYPGQGRAKFIEVLPAFKPKNADLAEDEIIRKALQKSGVKSGQVIPIKNISYNETTNQWTVEFSTLDHETILIDIMDK